MSSIYVKYPSSNSSSQIVLNGSVSGSLTFLANPTTTSYSITWPAAQGAANTFLKNDGSGNLTWAAAGAANAFVSGGNAFGGNTSFGLTDGFQLNFITNNTTAGSISNTQAWILGIASSSTTQTINGARLNLNPPSANFFTLANNLSNGGLAIYGADPGGGGNLIRLFGTAYGGGQNNQVDILQNGIQMFILDTNGKITIGQSGGTQTHVINGSLSLTGSFLSPAITTPVITGVTDGSSAAAGKVGQELKSYSGGGGSPTFVGSGTTGQFYDIASVSLTAGDWLITIKGEANLNSSTITEESVGISTTTGNSGTGLVNGDNFMDIPLPISTDNVGFCLANYHQSISSTTIYYFKGFASFSVGSGPNVRGTINAIRIR